MNLVMGKIATVASWIFLALISCSVIKILLILDYNKKIYDHVPGPCQKIEGIRFSVTDVELLPDGHAIISSGYHKTLIADAKKKRKGRLYAYDFSLVQNLNKTLKQAAIEIKLIFDSTTALNFNDQGRFNPVALTSFVSKNVINLYLINSIADYDSVECFIYDKNAKTATHMKTIKDENIYKYLYWKCGSEYPAQIILHLYMSMGLQESVRVYNMHRDASIEKHIEISLLTTANKMTFDFDSGDLYIAAFPILHEALSLRIYSALGRTSSHVLRVKLQDKEVRQWVINEMLANSGSMISGSEVAVYYHSLLIVGSLGGKLMICEAPITETY